MTPLAVFVLVGAMSGQRPSAPSVLSDDIRAHLRSETLVPVTHVAELPKSVQEALKTLFKSDALNMADPGKDFQVTDVILTPDLPIRRLIVAGCGADHCLVHFEQGGIAHWYAVVLVSITKAGATVQYQDRNSGWLPTLADVKSHVVDQGRHFP